MNMKIYKSKNPVQEDTKKRMDDINKIINDLNFDEVCVFETFNIKSWKTLFYSSLRAINNGKKFSFKSKGDNVYTVIRIE